MKKEDIEAEKARLRQVIRRKMKEMSPEERQCSDKALRSSFLLLPELERAETVLLYYGIKGEVETKHLIPRLLTRGKLVYLPCCLPNHQMEARLVQKCSDLLPGAFGIPEPASYCPILPQKQLDLILVPALSCDRSGVRLGQGGGYYDRYLKQYSGTTVSLCRKKFLKEKLPWDAFDQRVKIVLTEEECLVPTETQ